MIGVRVRPRPAAIDVLALLAVVLATACGSTVDQGTSTTTTVDTTTTVSETASTIVEPTTTSIGTTTTEPATTPTEADVTEIVVEGGEVVTAPNRIEAGLGSTVILVVVSDVVDHVHVHGYDVFFDVAPDSPAEIQFVADVPGIFEVELEDANILLVELEVR